MFSLFGLISRGGEQVVGVVVYEGTSCLEKLSRLFSSQRIETLIRQSDETKKSSKMSQTMDLRQNVPFLPLHFSTGLAFSDSASSWKTTQNLSIEEPSS